MKVINKVKKLCLCCMTEHEVQTVEICDNITFKGKIVGYNAIYEYCELADEYYVNEDMISKNDLAMKNAYREENNLLTTDKIINIRKKYALSQKDLACLLGWGEKTITRYEGHQVQDMAHDTVLRKIGDDPEWFFELLELGKDNISNETYKKTKLAILKEYQVKQDEYLRKSIQAQYIIYQDNKEFNGNTNLNFNKLVEVINYYANSKRVTNLYKVKLMKLLWYADFLAYKRYNCSITGLIYKAMPMGALPIAHKSIINLKGINYEEIEFKEGTGYKFLKSNNIRYDYLSHNDELVLDCVIEILGDSSTEEIVNKMHDEVAYKETKKDEIISYKYAKYLSI